MSLTLAHKIHHNDVLLYLTILDVFDLGLLYTMSELLSLMFATMDLAMRI